MPSLAQAFALGCLALVLAGIFALQTTRIAPGCSGRIVDVQTALVRSDEQLARVASADNAAKCPVYRDRVSLLRTASSLGAVCGEPQALHNDQWRGIEAEARAYENLRNQVCGGFVSTPPAEQSL